MDPTKIDSILQWERPKNATEIWIFLGLIGYYQHFVQDFLKITTPLSRLTRKILKFI